MKMPDIRIRLHEIADEHGIEELHVLAEETRRRHNQAPAPKVSRKVTPELRRRVRRFADANPDVPMHKICTLFEVNQGRISEIKHGKRS